MPCRGTGAKPPRRLLALRDFVQLYLGVAGLALAFVSVLMVSVRIVDSLLGD